MTAGLVLTQHKAGHVAARLSPCKDKTVHRQGRNLSSCLCCSSALVNLSIPASLQAGPAHRYDVDPLEVDSHDPLGARSGYLAPARCGPV